MKRTDGYPLVCPPEGAGNVFDWIIAEAQRRRAAQRAQKALQAARRR